MLTIINIIIVTLFAVGTSCDLEQAKPNGNLIYSQQTPMVYYEDTRSSKKTKPITNDEFFVPLQKASNLKQSKMFNYDFEIPTTEDDLDDSATFAPSSTETNVPDKPNIDALIQSICKGTKPFPILMLLFPIKPTNTEVSQNITRDKIVNPKQQQRKKVNKFVQ